MTESTLVSVYEVDEDGSTGALLGSGSLIHPALVLVHPDLSHALAAGRDRRLRAGIASPAPGSTVVEVIDVRAIQVAEDPELEPLVALDLVRPATAPVEPMHPASADAMAAAIRQHLDQLRPTPSPPIIFTPIICGTFPNAWFC